MRKDIEWLKDRILATQESYVAERDSFEPHNGGRRYYNGTLSSISLILDLINQLDYPEVLSEEWLDENKSSWTKLKVDGYYIPVEKLQNLLVPKHVTETITRAFDVERTSQAIEALTNMTIEEIAGEIRNGNLVPKQGLDVLSQEWIEGNTSPVDDEGRLYIWKRDLENLIVPKQELPVMPQFVADWIEAERGTMSNWKLPSGFISDSKYKKDQRRYKWSQVEGNMDKFMSALINGYEVEKEKLYVVELSNSNGRFGKYENVFLNKRDGIVFIDSSRLFVNDIKKYSQYALTEKEIKDYDERYWSFAVEVDICNK